MRHIDTWWKCQCSTSWVLIFATGRCNKSCCRTRQQTVFPYRNDDSWITGTYLRMPLFTCSSVVEYIRCNDTVAGQYLSDCVATVSAASGRYRLRSIGLVAYICQEQELDLEKVDFSSAVQPPGTLPSDLHGNIYTITFSKWLKSVLFDHIAVNHTISLHEFVLDEFDFDYCWLS